MSGRSGVSIVVTGPVNGDAEYNGETYDARLETPGWTAPGFAADTQQWLPVKVTTKTNKLQHTVLAAAAFPAIEKIHTFVAHTITEPSPGRQLRLLYVSILTYFGGCEGVWVIDFEQNLSGWIRIHITGAAGTRVQLRHAEALQHPPYGPYNGNIYVGNLRGARVTQHLYACCHQLREANFQDSVSVPSSPHCLLLSTSLPILLHPSACCIYSLCKISEWTFILGRPRHCLQATDVYILKGEPAGETFEPVFTQHGFVSACSSM